MKDNATTLKKTLLAIVLGALMLPLIQQHVTLLVRKSLKGAIVPKQKPEFSKRSWWEGTYQESYSEWYNENFGFRADFVRLHNQVAFSLFHLAKANGVIIGKENYLYEENYIKAYTGKDFIGKPAIDEMTTKLRVLQDSLEKKNITLVVCLASGKGSYYPEYIPDIYGPASEGTNYKLMASSFAEKGVNCIDFNKWFIDMKNKVPYALYPKTGIHWSRYGSMMVIDSLIKYVEYKRKVDMPNVVWNSIEVSDTLRSPDADIGEAMNLMFPITPLENMRYANFAFEDTTGKSKVALMSVSDSFFWSLFDVGLGPNAFSTVDFYYYNNEVYHSDGRPMSQAAAQSGMEDASKHDVVMIMATEANLWGLGWGFINTAFDHFVVHKMVRANDELVQSYEAEIRKSEKWMQDIKLKADAAGISLDSMIYLDAKYMADERLKNGQ